MSGSTPSRPATRPSMMRSASVVGFMTILSRITGMLQSRLLAYYLGVNVASDAFIVAYRIPNLLRRFTAEGTMVSVLVPTLSEVENSQGAEAGREMVAKFLGTLVLVLSLVCALGIPAMGLLAGLAMLGQLAPGIPWWHQFGILWRVLQGVQPSPQWVLTTTLSRIMFPYLALVSLTAGLSAVLNLRGRFGLPASVSTFWNIAFIGFALACLHWGPVSWRAPNHAAVVMAVAAMVGGFVQLFVQWPTFRRLGFSIRWGLHFRHPGVRKALKRMAPGLLGSGIAPINMFISTILASQLAVGAQTVLVNSSMMGEMVLGIFAASLATVSLPTMSRLVDTGDIPGLRTSLADALRGTAVLVIPASLGLAVLAWPIVAVIFKTGRFDIAAVSWHAHTVVFQAIGLLFIATSRIVTQCLYALKDYKKPALAALMGVIINIGLSIVLMGPLGTAGIALANGLASLAGLGFLTVTLRRRVGALPFRQVLGGWLSMGSAAGLMGGAAFAGLKVLGLDRFHGTGGTSLRLLPLIGLCALVYAALLFAFRVPEAKAIQGLVLRKFGSRNREVAKLHGKGGMDRK